MNTDGIEIRFKLKEGADLNRLEKIIISKGGKSWCKDDKKRVYFADGVDLEIASNVRVQPYSPYVDMITGELAFWVNKKDWESEKNTLTAEDYKIAFINTLKSQKQ